MTPDAPCCDVLGAHGSKTSLVLYLNRLTVLLLARDGQYARSFCLSLSCISTALSPFFLTQRASHATPAG